MLERTPEIEEVLSQLYPYAHQRPETYPFFLVLTQSCDLQLHDADLPKADYITVAAVRPLRYVLERELKRCQSDAELAAGICFSDKKQKLTFFVQRLLSNEQDPYFYLHPDVRTPFQEPHIAHLRITFPLQTDKHYGKCIKAKKLQLTLPFQAKLGWLTTLVFGQVATEDFAPTQRKRLARTYVEGIGGVRWLKRHAFMNMVHQHHMQGSLKDLCPDDIQALIDEYTEGTYPGMVANRATQIVQNVLGLSESKVDELRSAMVSDRDLTSLLSA